MKDQSHILLKISDCISVSGFLLIACLLVGPLVLRPDPSFADVFKPYHISCLLVPYTGSGWMEGLVTQTPDGRVSSEIIGASHSRSLMDKPPSSTNPGVPWAIMIGFVSLSIIVVLLLISDLHRRRAAKSLKAARDRYESMFKHNAVALFEEDCLALKAEVEQLQQEGITDMAGYLNAHPQHVREMAKMLKVLDVNPAALRLYGADSKEELLESFGRIFTPDSLDGFKQVVVAIAAGHSSLECETVSQKLTGQRLYVILSATFPQSRIEFSRILFSVVDITERKRSLEVMHRSEERFRTVFDNAASGMALVDLRGHYIRVNEAFQRMVGYPAKELEWKNWREVTHPEDISLTKKMIISLIAGQHVQPVEKRYINKQGKTIWALVNIALMVNKRRKPLYYIIQVQDISQMKNEQEKMREREERYRQIFEADLSGFYIAKPDGEFLLCNKVFADILGFTYVEEVIGQNFCRFFNQPDLGSKLLHDLSDQKKIEHVEAAFVRHDGTVIHVLLNSAGRFNPQGELIEIMGYLMDITRQKNLEAQLLHVQKMESVGTMAGGVAHDFNNLLMGILGNTSLLMMDRGNDHANYDRLKNIEHYVKCGSDLTRQLLGFAKGGKYQVRTTDLNLMIQQSIAMFARTHQTLQVHTSFADAIWPVEADRNQIDQVLYNMYVNAWQAMKNSGHLFVGTKNKVITAEAVDAHGMMPGRYVEIEITDTGIGIASDALPRIFDPFFTTKERSRGTGLGLASSYGIIQSHGGCIKVTSLENEGSSFFIYLPVSENESLQEEPTSMKNIPGGTETILLVDDQEIIIVAVSRMMILLGYTVLTARSGTEAIDIYKSQWDTIDLVILDMIMPGMSGGDTFDQLKEINPEIDVLLSSGYSADGQAQEILLCECRGFIQKPFTLGQLSRKLHEILRPSSEKGADS
jgi:two-component system, cell cycle sensor histidine kinase and response regulator CckA